MSSYQRSCVSLFLSFLSVGAAARLAAQTPLKTIRNPNGGVIVYGLVDGATTQAAAMSQVLRNVHNGCNEKPKVGKLFKVRDTNSVAVFFTVTNHAGGDKAVAGLLIAALTAPNQVEAALVSDDAARFGTSVNPMLKQLFGVWHPGANAQPAGAKPAERYAPAEPLHRVANQDGSASLAVPAGWRVIGNGGTTLVNDPTFNVFINLNLVRGGTNPSYRQPYGRATGMGVPMVYPSNFDPASGFPGFIQEFYRVNNQRIDYRMTSAEAMPGNPGQRCIHSIGRGLLMSVGQPPPTAKPEDYPQLEFLACLTAPDRMGNYTVSISVSEIFLNSIEKERATVGAIMSSYQVNQAVVANQASAMAAPIIANIHRIGEQATARMNAVEQQNDEQHAGYWARQDSNARRNQSFDNYILDQTVIQNNDVYGNGTTIGHATVWNSTADALVKSDPNRYEIVNSPNFWKGWDY